MRGSLRSSMAGTGCVRVAVVAGLMAAAAAGKDWPQWRGPARDGKSEETGIITSWKTKKPKLVWMAEGAGEGYASVAVVGDRIYTAGNFDGGQGVVVLGSKDGKLLWRKVLTGREPQHGSPGARCTPTVDGGRLYVTTSDGLVACLSTAGEVVWKKDFEDEWGGRMMSGWGFAESVLVDGDVAVCTPGGRDALMVALDKKTGAEVWRCKAPDLGDNGNDGAGYASAVISNGAKVKQYVQMTGRGLVGVRASDGRLLWHYNRIANRTANIPDALVSGDHVFCSTGYGAGAALLRLTRDGDGVKAEEVYFLNSRTLQNHHGGMVLVDGYVYCGHKHNGGDPICIELKTGKVMWGPEKPAGRRSGCVTYADGHLIYRYESGEVALVEATPKGYRPKGSFKPEHQERESWAHPVVSGGRLYLREQDKVMCYQL